MDMSAAPLFDTVSLHYHQQLRHPHQKLQIFINPFMSQPTAGGAQHPDILYKMIASYDKFAKDVGVIVPAGVRAQAFESIATDRVIAVKKASKELCT